MSASLQRFLLAHRGYRGIYSVCTAQRWPIEAAMQQALRDGTQLLIEATSNQVNQEGGYTGLTPGTFKQYVLGIANQTGFPAEALIFGGDHLGPNPWQKLPAKQAMLRASTMVRDYAAAGFTKIHLDASMPCADDPPSLPDELIAERAAALCTAAESVTSHPGSDSPVYVIGTEVPPPGGASSEHAGLAVTTCAAAQQTLNVHRDLFHNRGLDSAWERVLALVVQPGVEFDHNHIVEYDAEKARHLASFLEAHPQLVFEAHSTDYQRPSAYTELIRDGFSILKVGPALTFAMREALVALAAIEAELIPPATQSKLLATIENSMLNHPANWQAYYPGSADEQRLLRLYSYSDRIRYYWHCPEVTTAVDRLLGNLGTVSIPDTLLSQYLPEAYNAVRYAEIESTPPDLIHHKIGFAIKPYAAACRNPVLA